MVTDGPDNDANVIGHGITKRQLLATVLVGGAYATGLATIPLMEAFGSDDTYPKEGIPQDSASQALFSLLDNPVGDCLEPTQLSTLLNSMPANARITYWSGRNIVEQNSPPDKLTALNIQHDFKIPWIKSYENIRYASENIFTFFLNNGVNIPFTDKFGNNIDQPKMNTWREFLDFLPEDQKQDILIRSWLCLSNDQITTGFDGSHKYETEIIFPYMNKGKDHGLHITRGVTTIRVGNNAFHLGRIKVRFDHPNDPSLGLELGEVYQRYPKRRFPYDPNSLTVGLKEQLGLIRVNIRADQIPSSLFDIDYLYRD